MKKVKHVPVIKPLFYNVWTLPPGGGALLFSQAGFQLLLYISDRLLSAGHDISDGGLISCLLEMGFAGNRGIDVELSSNGCGGEENVWKIYVLTKLSVIIFDSSL